MNGNALAVIGEVQRRRILHPQDPGVPFQNFLRLVGSQIAAGQILAGGSVLFVEQGEPVPEIYEHEDGKDDPASGFDQHGRDIILNLQKGREGLHDGAFIGRRPNAVDHIPGQQAEDGDAQERGDAGQDPFPGMSGPPGHRGRIR